MAFSEIAIEELCVKVTSGLTPLRSRSDFYHEGTIDWFKTGELNDWYLDAAAERITQAALRETSIKLFPADTVLLAMYGDGKTMTSMGMLRSPAATNQACAAMIVDEKKCIPRYFFYALKGRRNLLLKVASGGAQRNLSGKLMKEFRLPIPALEDQERIANILSAYDELIENSQRRIKILEAMACSVPVVATSMGLGDIGAKAGKDILISDTSDSFVESVLLLLKSDDLHAKIGDSGFQYVNKHHTWDALNAKFESFIISTLS